MRTPVIISAVRTPSGKFLGALKTLQAPQLGAAVVLEAVSRAGVDPAAVEECIMGNVLSAGVGQAPARQAALNGGLSNSVAALTINKVCGSGLKAVMLAAQATQQGNYFWNMAAISMVAIAPVLVLGITLQRWIVQGLSSGGLK